MAHLALNSSKVSSACSPERRRALVLKLLAAGTPATTVGRRMAERAIKGWLERMGFARKKVVEPRAATRMREEVDIFGGWRCGFRGGEATERADVGLRAGWCGVDEVFFFFRAREAMGGSSG